MEIEYMGEHRQKGDAIAAGNAASEGMPRGGWFLGHFIPETSPLLHSDRVEVKWATHAAGDERSEWAANERAATLSILVRGRFLICFADRRIILDREGDYALWAPGVPHTWRCEEESTIVTLRWPSLAGDSVGKR